MLGVKETGMGENSEKMSILIADDDRVNRETLRKALEQEYRVAVEGTGAGALEAAGRDRPDLVLLEVALPDMAGFAVLLELKDADLTRGIPVMCITGPDADEQEKCFHLGAVDCITKPLVPALVKARVRTHLQIVRQMREIQRLGMIDPLTDLPNKRNFDYHLHIMWEISVRDRMPIGLLTIDLDNFKRYNDTYGHPQGDRLLRALTDAINASIRRQTDFAARVGGEEFAVILPNTGPDGALGVAEMVRANVEKMRVPLVQGGEMTAVTASVGVAVMAPRKGDEEEDLVLASDKALYDAKNTGRNCVRCRNTI